MNKLDLLVQQFAQLDTIPVVMAEKLIKLLEAAPSEVLRQLVDRKVKFCWLVAQRILRER